MTVVLGTVYVLIRAVTTEITFTVADPAAGMARGGGFKKQKFVWPPLEAIFSTTIFTGLVDGWARPPCPILIRY